MTAIDMHTARELSLRHGARRVVLALFSTIAAINLLAVLLTDSPYIRTHLTAATLAVYVAVEMLRFLRRSDVMGLFTPVFLALFAHFTLGYLGAITVAVFDPWAIRYFTRWLPDLDVALSETLLLAMLAAFCMMRAYEATQPLARRLRRSAQRWPALRRDIRPAMTLAVILQFAYIGLVSLSLNLGIYGMVGNAADQARYVDVVQYLRLATAAGTLSYFLILLRYFHLRAQGRGSFALGTFCGLLVLLHLVAGTLSGFKSQMATPFIIAGVAYFLATRRFPRGFVLMGVVALVMSYSVIEPFRSYLALLGENSRPRGVIEAVEAVATAYDLREEIVHHNSDISRGEQIVTRFDMSGMTSVGIDYVQRGDLQTHVRQDLQDSILLAPVLAYVPRAVWPDKPSYSPGAWFNQTVLAKPGAGSTSVAMGPIAYLYMAGGVVMVCFGFALWGVMGALLFDGLARSGAGGLIIFLSVASGLIFIKTTIGPTLAGNLRMIVVAFVAQWIMLRPDRPRGAP